MEIHVFNGDCAYDAWKTTPAAAAPGVVAVVLRESYFEGRLPPPETPPAEFAAVRAAELRRLMPDLEVPEARLRAFLEDNERVLRQAAAGDRVWLWFDACMFDQLLLARAVFVLRDVPADAFLVCDDVVWGADPGRFAARRPGATRLEASDRAFFAAGWEAAARGPEALRAFLAAPWPGLDARFPFFRPGIARFAAERPVGGGLGRSQEQLLRLVAEGQHDFIAIFRGFDRFEEHPFLGDTACRRLLADLVAAGRLREEDGRWFLPGAATAPGMAGKP